MVKTEKITGAIKNEPIKVKSTNKPPATPSNLIKLHALSAFIGSRGSGKTNTAVLLAQKLKQAKAIERIFIISPTYYSNPVFSVLDIDPDDVYTDIETVFEALDDIKEKVQLEKENYDDYIEYKNIIEKLITKGENALTFKEISLLELNDYKLPFHKYGGKKPGLLLIVDDMSHSKIFSNGRNPFTNLCLRHRHLSGGLGLSIFMLVQNFKTGLPKALRQNITQIAIYKSHDNTQIKEMYHELLANKMKLDEFMDLYNHATKNEHDFLFLDFNPQDKKYQYRQNFDISLKL